MSNDSVRRIPLADAASEGLITLNECAKLTDITLPTATKRLKGVGLLGVGSDVVAFGTRETAGRPARLFDREEALEACLNSVGHRRAAAERDSVDLDLTPAATEADAALAEIAGAS